MYFSSGDLVVPIYSYLHIGVMQIYSAEKRDMDVQRKEPFGVVVWRRMLTHPFVRKKKRHTLT